MRTRDSRLHTQAFNFPGMYAYPSILFSLYVFIIVLPIGIFLSLSPPVVCLLFGSLLPLSSSSCLAVLSLKLLRHGCSPSREEALIRDFPLLLLIHLQLISNSCTSQCIVQTRLDIGARQDNVEMMLSSRVHSKRVWEGLWKATALYRDYETDLQDASNQAIQRCKSV